MFYLDTQQKVDQSPHKQELQGGQLHIEERPVSKPKKKQGKKKGGKEKT